MSESALHIVPERFRQTALSLGPKTALRQKKYGLWEDLSWTNYYEKSRQVAQALLELGIQKGDFIGILGENCPEWLMIDMGAQMIGAVSVGIYTTSSWKQVQYIANHAGCRVLFAENEEQVDKWLQMRENTPQLEKVVYWDEKGLKELEEDNLIDFEAFMRIGEQAEMALPNRIETCSAEIQPDDLAILVYTSGTTGPPKGAMLTHRNLCWMGQAVEKIDPGNTVREKDEVMSFLPLCHIFERLFSVYVHLHLGYTVNFVESPDSVPQNLREISPTVGYAVPRIWEKYHASIVIRMADAKPFKKWVYHLAMKVGMKHAQLKLTGKAISSWLNLLFFMANKGVFYFLKQRLGLERMRFAFSGAAPIAPDVLTFFHAIGLNLIEGYGQTEGGGVSSAIAVPEFKLGTVGKAIPGGEIKLAADGEILLKSPGVFKGYYKNPQATATTLQNGWLHSGDIGQLDTDGYLKIIDRKKDLIITAGGKNIAPQFIENKLKFSPFINDAIIIGDKRKFISAIVVLDEENINQYAQTHKIQFSTYADLAENTDIQQLIQGEVNKVNKELARVEQVRKFRILSKRLYEEDGEITPTMKVKRGFINKAYADLIETMYKN